MHDLYQDQQLVFNKIISSFKGSNVPVVADLSVAFGKTLLIAHLGKHVINKGGQVLSLAHKQELIMDAVETFGADECAVYCAALGRKEMDKKMIYASPQSLVNHVRKLPRIDLLILDECHMLNDRNPNSSYMKIIIGILSKNKKCRILGLTGTPFRLEKGKTSLIVGEKRLFKKIVATAYFKDLLALGRVTKPITPHSHAQSYDFSNVKMKMGKFQDKELNEVVKNERLTRTIIKDVVDHCENRNKILIFASTLQHAKEIQGYLHEFDQTCGYLDGKLKTHDREQALNDFKTGATKYLVNKDMLTTGYNEKAIDAIVFLRPSESRALVIQCVGRGGRKHNSKTDFLVLDYANNFESLDDLITNENIKSIKEKNGKQSEEIIVCPDCGALCTEHQHKCKSCGHYFISKICEKCDTQQAISNRHCVECHAELIDPNIPLTQLASGAEAFRAKVLNTSLSSHTKNKLCLRVDILPDDKLNGYPTLSQFLAQGSWLLKHWVKHHLIKAYHEHDFVMRDLAITAFYDDVSLILKSRDLFVMDEVVTYQKVKGKKYFNVIDEA